MHRARLVTLPASERRHTETGVQATHREERQRAVNCSADTGSTANYWRVEIVEEHSHTGDPQLNGDVEQAVRTIKSNTISILTSIERSIKQIIPLSHPIVGWAAQFAADCMNRCVIRENGQTTYQRLRGGNARQLVAIFGECVLFPMLKREQESFGDEVEHAGRWAKGIWLGCSWNSN